MKIKTRLRIFQFWEQLKWLLKTKIIVEKKRYKKQDSSFISTKVLQYKTKLVGKK